MHGYFLGFQWFVHGSLLRVTWALNCVPKSVIIVVGRYVCLQRISIITRATAEAVIRVAGYANKYLEKTSIVVII